MELMLGVGFTVMVNDPGVPEQLLAEGVTVMVAETATLPVLTALNEGIGPLPLAARPMDGSLFVQLYVDVPIFPEGFTALVLVPLHTV